MGKQYYPPPVLNSLHAKGKLQLHLTKDGIQLTGDKDLVQKIEVELARLREQAPRQIEEDRKNHYALQQLYKTDPEFRKLYDAACKRARHSNEFAI